MDIDPRVYEEVCEYYRNALENGYKINLMHSADVASEIYDMSSIDTSVSFETIHECVRRYRLSR